MSPSHTIKAICPLCGQVMREKTVWSHRWGEYGDPRITCPHCGKETTDDNITELALRPREWYTQHATNRLIKILLFAMPFILLLLLGAVASATEIFRNMNLLLGVVIVLACFALGLIPALRYTTGRHDFVLDEAFEAAYLQSEKRLREEPGYKRFLVDSGYLKRLNIPE